MKSTSSCQTPSDVVFARAKALWYPPHKKAIIVHYYILHISFLLCKSNKTNWMFDGKCYDDSKQPGGQSKLLYCRRRQYDVVRTATGCRSVYNLWQPVVGWKALFSSVSQLYSLKLEIMMLFSTKQNIQVLNIFFWI